jgi:hypothetical protein
MARSIARSILLSLRMEGPRRTWQRTLRRLQGERESCIFLRPLKPPATPVHLPTELNGVVVREMQASDLEDPSVRWHEPDTPYRLSEGVVATRAGQIVGAAWYVDSVNATQPWYRAIEPHLMLPARFAVNLFVAPDDRGAAWALGRTATDALASAGVRSIVGIISATNTRSILMTRLLGSKMVARVKTQRRFGRTTVTVDPVSDDRESGITAPPG